jgi:hypothetical protein
MRYRDKGQFRGFCRRTSEQHRQFACDYQWRSGDSRLRHRRDVRFSKEHLTGVEIDQESTVHLRTANGIVQGKRGRAQTIQLRSLLAKDVPVVAQAGEYGAGIDELLGMSFLSRFNINIDAKTVRISPRTTR